MPRRLKFTANGFQRQDAVSERAYDLRVASK
jgi:hypothetical protein